MCARVVVLLFKPGTHIGCSYQNQTEVKGLPQPPPAQASHRLRRGPPLPCPRPAPEGAPRPARAAGRAEGDRRAGAAFRRGGMAPGSPSPRSVPGPFRRLGASPRKPEASPPPPGGRGGGRAGATLPAPGAPRGGAGRVAPGPLAKSGSERPNPAPWARGGRGRAGRPGGRLSCREREDGRNFHPRRRRGTSGHRGERCRHGPRRAAAGHLRRGGRRRPAPLGRVRALQEEEVPGRRGAAGRGAAAAFLHGRAGGAGLRGGSRAAEPRIGPRFPPPAPPRREALSAPAAAAAGPGSAGPRGMAGRGPPLRLRRAAGPRSRSRSRPRPRSSARRRPRPEARESRGWCGAAGGGGSSAGRRVGAVVRRWVLGAAAAPGRLASPRLPWVRGSPCSKTRGARSA